MYQNLNAEMARYNITVTVLSEKTGIPYSTLAPKVRGEKPIKLQEADVIRNAINKDLTLDYLFDVQALEAVE